LPNITEFVISSYPTISQQFLGFKKLSFVGEIHQVLKSKENQWYIAVIAGLAINEAQ